MPGISITGPTVSDIGDVLEALKLALQLEEAEQALTETTYMVLPPNKDAMRAKIIGARDVRNGQTIFLPTLTGEQLDGNEAADWTRKVGTYQQNVEDRLQDYLTQGLKELSRLRTTMRLRVVFGTIALTRCKEQFKQPGLIYDEFVEMMSNTMLGGLFYKK